MTVMVGNGALLKLNSTTVGQRVSITPPARTRAEVQSTHLDSTNEEYEPGLADLGTVQLEYEYYPQDTSHQAVLTSYSSGSVDTWTIVYPDETEDEFDGFITAYTPGAMTSNATCNVSITIRVKGDITTTLGDDGTASLMGSIPLPSLEGGDD